MTYTQNAPERREDRALLFRHFSFRYRAQTEPTLVDINLPVNRGEKILILGPSGSGKSTLIHCVNGIIPHAFGGESSGVLEIFGEGIGRFGIFDISKKAGTVLQDTDGQFVGLSAAEDIAFALENDCVPSAAMKSRVAAAVALVDMAAYLGKSPHELSGGQKQRVSLAGVLVDDVEILLFDEPLANLDPAAGKDAIELIDELHKKTGKTILIVEHRLEDVLHRSVDRIVLMDGGRIAADAPPAEILASGILEKAGIREPLYLSALRYAGVRIDAASSAQSLETLTADYAPLRAWDGKLRAAASSSAPDDSPAVLEIRGIRFRYSGQDEEALKGVSFSVGRGECVALAGKNGSGKSTLAKCVCGFLHPDAGDVCFNGSSAAGLSISERSRVAGYVMQNPNQMISFPMIYDEAAFGLRNRGTDEQEVKNRVYEALNVCGLFPFRNWPVGALSYGQKKRLTIASILTLRPSIMILDEPTAGQDFRHYTEFMEFLFGLKRGFGLSLLLVTHDMHLMLEYASRAVILSGGSLVADLSPEAALTDGRIIAAANLKRTSLYSLALSAGLSDPEGFPGRFAVFERGRRG